MPEIGQGKLEKVQERSIKMIRGYKDLSYEEGLKMWTNNTGEKEEQRRLKRSL